MRNMRQRKTRSMPEGTRLRRKLQLQRQLGAVAMCSTSTMRKRRRRMRRRSMKERKSTTSFEIRFTKKKWMRPFYHILPLHHFLPFERVCRLSANCFKLSLIFPLSSSSIGCLCSGIMKGCQVVWLDL